MFIRKQNGVPCISYTVSLDILLDIVKIILQEDISHSIRDIKESKSAVVLELALLPLHEKAKENIEQILNDYNYYRYGMSESDMCNE